MSCSNPQWLKVDCSISDVTDVVDGKENVFGEEYRE